MSLVSLTYSRNKELPRSFFRRKNLEERVQKERIRQCISIKANPLPLLSQQYHIDSKNEIVRLKRVSQIYARFRKQYLEDHNRKEDTSIALGHSLELAQELQDAGYYVFLHGQSLGFGALSDLVSEMWRSKQCGETDRYHRIWRAEGVSQRWKNVEEYKDSKFSERIDEMNRESMISVDALFSCSQYTESAYDFYWRGRNILWRGNILKLLSETFEIKDKKFIKELEDLSEWLKSSRGGRMNVIAIPKHLLQNKDTCFVFRAHPYGSECNCYDSSHETFIKTLEMHQQNVFKLCKSQYRILTHGLDTHKEVRTFTFDSISSEKKKKFEQMKKTLIEKWSSYQLLGRLSKKRRIYELLDPL